jgi:hypothetical protein
VNFKYWRGKKHIYHCDLSFVWINWLQKSSFIGLSLTFRKYYTSVSDWQFRNSKQNKIYLMECQLVPYDAVNRNKVSIRQLSLFYSYSLHVSSYGPSSGEIYNWCFQGLFLLQRIRCTYTTWRMSILVLGNINCISHLRMARRGRNM